MRQRNRPAKRPLTAVAVKYVKTPGRHWDGNGLYLVVDESGARRWLLRIYVQGRRRDIGLGSARLVPLVTAREIAIEMHRVARDDGDPLAERRKRRRIAPTFKEAATQVHCIVADLADQKRDGAAGAPAATDGARLVARRVFAQLRQPGRWRRTRAAQTVGPQAASGGTALC